MDTDTRRLSAPVNVQGRRGSDGGRGKKSSKRIKTNKEIFDEAVEKKESVLNIPIPLSEKIKFLKNPTYRDLNMETNQLSKTVSKFWITFLYYWNHLLELLEPWTNETKQIEGSFGTGVGSYFRLLRTFLYINLGVAIITVIFLIVPILIGHEPRMTYDSFRVSNIFLGTGYFENTVLFYGSPFYSYNSSILDMKDGWLKNYSVSKGYFWTMMAGYAIFIFSVLANFVSSYKSSFIASAELEGKQFGATVFSSWQMSVSDEATANMLQNKIYEDFLKLVQLRTGRTKQARQEARARSQELLVPRLLVVVLALAAMGATCYGVWLLLDYVAKYNKDVFYIPLILSLILTLFPWMLQFTNKVDKINLLMTNQP